MIEKPLTHRVAVNAFLINSDRFLLLKRTREPLIWGPPGGRLHPDEDPLQGLKREVLEETGLEIKVFDPVVTWFGEFNQTTLLSVDYLCQSDRDDVVLSKEHDAHCWLTFEMLNTNQNIYFSPNLGFDLSNFSSAWISYLVNKKRWDDLRQFESRG